MLVLRREVGEQIRIGPDVLVTVMQIKGGKVRIGVEAPLDVRVDREEVHQGRLAGGDPALDAGGRPNE